MFNFLVTFCILCFFAALGKNNYNRPLIKALSGSYLSIPVTYYTDGQYDADTDDTNYFVLNQCSQSSADQKYVHLSIIAPDNPSLDTRYAYPVLELSKCKTSWDSECFIGSNYLWSSHPIIFNNISWTFENQPETIYIRYRSYNRHIPITLLVTYSNDGYEQLGNFTAGVIPGLTAPSNAVFDTLKQYVRTSSVSTVQNGDSKGFFFSFCGTYSPYNNDYQITANVVGDINSPLSAFDLIVCAYSNTPNIDDCTTANLDAVTDQDAAPLVYASLNNDESTDLSQGVWLVITGQGGNINLENKFTIDVTVESS